VLKETEKEASQLSVSNKESLTVAVDEVEIEVQTEDSPHSVLTAGVEAVVEVCCHRNKV
jgi:hypothetical protein